MSAAELPAQIQLERLRLTFQLGRVAFLKR
jgi:hypothetical protein